MAAPTESVVMVWPGINADLGDTSIPPQHDETVTPGLKQRLFGEDGELSFGEGGCKEGIRWR
jgi:hypothetical protein